MAHLMEQKRFASKVKNPWWNNGENFVFPGLTNEELFEASRCNMVLDLQNIFDKNGTPIKDYYILYNVTSGQHIDIKKGRFSLTQPQEYFDAITQLGDIESIGATNDCKTLFFNFDGGEFSIGEGGNSHKGYLSFIVPYDGSKSVVGMLTNTRSECNNTVSLNLSKAFKRGAENVLKAKQTKDCMTKVNNWVSTIVEMQNQQQGLIEAFKYLANVKYSPKRQSMILHKIFGVVLDDNTEISARTRNNIDKVAQILGDNASKIPQGQRGTGYDLFNAVTYYTNHERSLHSHTDQMESVLFGTSQKFAEDAFKLIMETPSDVFDRAITI